MQNHIIDDAKRCLQCKKPLCQKGCPIGTPIKEAIGLLLDSNLAKAGQLLFDNNPLSLVCSYICPQENQCEGHCVLGKTGSPVYISAIEKYISDYYLNIAPQITKSSKGTDASSALENKRVEKIGIIGSGPAGLAIAFFLLKLGYDITIFEGNDRAGGILRYGIPEFRLPKNIIDRLVGLLTRSGVKVRPNTTIGSNLTIDDLMNDGFDAIFIGTGTWRPRRLNIKGESLGHVHFAIDYLKNPDVYSLGDSLIVIGAGNVAMDAARTAFRHGCKDVTIFYHRDESQIPAREHELQYAKIDGAKLELSKTAVEITEKGVIFADSEIVTIDEKADGENVLTDDKASGENVLTDAKTDGKATAVGAKTEIRAKKGTEKLYEASSVIIAVSQGPRSLIISSTKGINTKENGLAAVDEFGHTSRTGVFAGGDVVTGAKTVVEAVVAARRVAASIHEYLQSKNATK